MAASDSIISIGEEAECEECEEFGINIPPLMPPAEWPECCIYRVPKKLRKVNEEAYTPKLVSIGPFHHCREELKDMEMQKLRYLKDFLDQTGKSKEDLLKIIQNKEEKIRHCYSEDFTHISSNHFAKMILLDAIFIIELFRRTKPWQPENGENDEDDYVIKNPWLTNGIRLDLILLENQLPFFILKKLFKFTGPEYHKAQKGGKNKEVTFLELSLNYFYVFTISNRIDTQLPENFNRKEVKHFTDLIRHVFCSVPGLTMKLKQDLDSRICATRLDDAGLKFKAVKERRLLDIKLCRNKCLEHFPCFNLSWLLACLPCLKKPFPWMEKMQSILEIPPLLVDSNTEDLFRNLMALEQCRYPLNSYIYNYVELLDYLIDADKDVDLLVQKKIIVNNIGSNEAVAKVINSLCLEIVVNKSCYSILGKEINDYSDNHVNRIMATMKSEFYRDFWRGTATTVALFVMLYQFWGFLRPFVIKRE
ncbi:UPF0481 protein At3g47200-like [Corylus avellana]|uniref:UPF0481 protein At3g47200-like n=1 Tax=Corylus avellana TaxID=13451 RepID=UPI00286BC61D|nr:UPF0481 protein At3g47200-like [Corylus avellana]